MRFYWRHPVKLRSPTLDSWFKNRAHRKLRQLVAETGLDMTGVHVYTEAATRSYCISAGLAVLAGAAAVHCVAKTTRYGSAQQAIDETRDFAKFMGVDLQRITFSEGHEPRALEQADLVTNSAPLRPLDAQTMRHLRAGTVISLMYEPWEWRAGDIDLAAAKQSAVWVVGVNENHPAVRCYPSVGMLALKGLFCAGMEVFTNDVLVVCANPFVNSMLAGLAPHCRSIDLLDRGCAGNDLPASVTRLCAEESNQRIYDAMVICDLPQPNRWNFASHGDAVWPRQGLGSWDTCVQIMGDVRREDFPAVKFVPEPAPPRAYMGMNPGDLGVDLVLRNIIAGLCAGAELLSAVRRSSSVASVWMEMAQMNWVLPMDEVEQRAH